MRPPWAPARPQWSGWLASIQRPPGPGPGPLPAALHPEVLVGEAGLEPACPFSQGTWTAPIPHPDGDPGRIPTCVRCFAGSRLCSRPRGHGSGAWPRTRTLALQRRLRFQLRHAAVWRRVRDSNPRWVAPGYALATRPVTTPATLRWSGQRASNPRPRPGEPGCRRQHLARDGGPPGTRTLIPWVQTRDPPVRRAAHGADGRSRTRCLRFTKAALYPVSYIGVV